MRKESIDFNCNWMFIIEIKEINMIMYAQIKGKSKGERVILSYNIEKELERNKMSIEDCLKETLMLNPDFERVYCR